MAVAEQATLLPLSDASGRSLTPASGPIDPTLLPVPDESLQSAAIVQVSQMPARRSPRPGGYLSFASGRTLPPTVPTPRDPASPPTQIAEQPLAAPTAERQ